MKTDVFLTIDLAVYGAVREAAKAPRVEVWEVYRGVDQGLYAAMTESVYWTRNESPPPQKAKVKRYLDGVS